MTENQSSSEDVQNKPVPALPIESAGNACDLTVFSEANKFAEAIIKKVPELHGVAIIPIWMPQLQDVPNGLLRLRDESFPHIGALLQMLGNLSAFSMDVNRDMMNQMRSVDQMAKDVATEVKNKLGELQAINAKTAESGAKGNE
jgi:hypothetical protein